MIRRIPHCSHWGAYTILVEDGRILDFGTHDELMETCEVYRAIAESQMKGGE